MPKILAFAASNSKTSINKQLVSYAAKFLAESEADIETEIIDLNDYELPLFSTDREAELKAAGNPHPELAMQFFNKIGEATAVVISFAEHNSTYSVAYKNIFDWASRINPEVFQDKPLLFLATSPGARGAASVLQQAIDSAPRFGGEVIGHFSLPTFQENFDSEQGQISHKEKQAELTALLTHFHKSI